MEVVGIIATFFVVIGYPGWLPAILTFPQAIARTGVPTGVRMSTPQRKSYLQRIIHNNVVHCCFCVLIN